MRWTRFERTGFPRLREQHPPCLRRRDENCQSQGRLAKIRRSALNAASVAQSVVAAAEQIFTARTESAETFLLVQKSFRLSALRWWLSVFNLAWGDWVPRAASREPSGVSQIQRLGKHDMHQSDTVPRPEEVSYARLSLPRMPRVTLNA